MAIHTLSIGGSNYEIQPKYASSAGYAATAGNAKYASSATYATLATTAVQANAVLMNGISTATNYPLLFAPSIATVSGTYQSLGTDTANSLHYNPSTNVLTVPSFNTSALGVSGGVTIYNGNDLNLQAASTAATDPGDIAFKNSSGTEIGRIWLDQGTNFKLRYGSTDAAKMIIHEGNISDYLTTQSMKTLNIATGLTGGDPEYNYTSYDGSSDVTIDVVVRAIHASSASYATTAGYAVTAGNARYASSASYATYAVTAGNARYASSASYATTASSANYAKYLHAATSTSKLYLLGQTTGASGGNLVYKNANTYISSNAIYASAGFYESSDARLKTITNDVEVDFERLKSIPKIQYIKKGETAPHIGTIAQDLQKVYPEFVETGEDGYMSVDYAKLSIIPLKAVDLLYDEMNKLKNELKTVKEENQVLKNRLDNIEAIINK